MDSVPPAESTATLLERARQGDEGARAALFQRFYPRLLRWTHGRLAPQSRDLVETDDIAQVALARALSRIGQFEPRHEGAFLAYLRRIALNEIRDQFRRSQRRPRHEGLEVNLTDPAPSPLEAAIGTETLERYERALTTLSTEQREAVILRVELGYSYEEVAQALGRPSANAARLLVARALVKLAEQMK
jgi:RNA polymerase sigma factor (sigma-70 family)